MEWLPIETAPKDVTKIVGFFVGYREEGDVWTTHWVGAKQEGCNFWWYEHTLLDNRPQPTHWVPFEQPKA